MKTHNYSSRSTILLLVVSLLFGAFVARQATAAEPRSSHAAATSQAPARLIITRMPNLGVNVIVELWIDGQRTATLGYARDYEGVLTPGRHVLGVLPTRSLSPTPWEMALNAQSGQTYIFSAGISSSGNVVLYSGGF
jgi:hypothetical protein